MASVNMHGRKKFKIVDYVFGTFEEAIQARGAAVRP